jgi:hypothetical protein
LVLRFQVQSGGKLLKVEDRGTGKLRFACELFEDLDRDELWQTWIPIFTVENVSNLVARRNSPPDTSLAVLGLHQQYKNSSL